MYEHPEITSGHAVFRTVKPGESVIDSEAIGRLFDMTKPGKYVIQVSRRIADGGNERVVKSNKIILTVE
jgi:hypothetical protein